MKLLFTRFPLESAYGGAEVQTMSLAQGLKKDGHAVAFLGSCPILQKLFREADLPVAELVIGPPPVSTWHALSFAWRKRKMQKQLEAALQQFTRLDAVLMLSMSEKLLLTPFLLERGIRVIWIEHDRVGRWLKNNPWLSRLQELSTQVTTVCVSELSAEIYRDLGWPADHVVAIPNGIDVERFAHIRNSNFEFRNSLHLGCVARLTADKGVDLLIDAVADSPGTTLDIVGSGREEGYIRHLIAERNEKVGIEIIRLLPPRKDVAAFYGTIDALVLPSREHDPFGLVAAEAMAAGRAVIVTKACGIASELTHGKDALIVDAHSSRALAQAIHVLSDEKKRLALAAAGKKTAMQHFTIEQMVGKYQTLLEASENKQAFKRKR